MSQLGWSCENKSSRTEVVARQIHGDCQCCHRRDQEDKKGYIDGFSLADIYIIADPRQIQSCKLLVAILISKS